MLDIVAASRNPARGRSAEARSLYADLQAVTPEIRRGYMKSLSAADMCQILTVADREGGTPFALWADDPVGFVYDVLRETLWSRPQEIMQSVVVNRRTAVPSCFSSGKTHSAARITIWWAYTNPVGLAKVVTMAPQWRQVVRLLWPEIRAAHSRAELPGSCDTYQLKLPNRRGHEQVVAYGLAAPPWNETAVQGIHSPRLLLVIDEAGGISHTIGNNVRGMLIGKRARLLAIGNPPTDEEGSWFEEICDNDEVSLLPISAHSTPAFTGEAAPRCRTCMDDAHPVTQHLVDHQWVDEAVEDNGEDSNYVIAKVHARFPRGGPSRALPSMWVDNAAESDEPDEGDSIRLCDLGLDTETAEHRVRMGAWIRLGVDVAADGGDELVIARCVGDLITVEKISVGPDNEHSENVAGMVLEEILRAERLRQRLGTKMPVRVKIDGLGVGWGVSGDLRSWAKEKIHTGEIVPVVVSEGTYREPESATLRPATKRDEMWLGMRALLQPSREFPDGRVRFRVDRKTLAQLRAPKRSTRASDGCTVIESKKSLRERGISSPDRAEAVLLVAYEPVLKPARKPAKVLATRRR